MLLATLLASIAAQPPAPSAVSVTTPAELQRAVRAGTAHILVTEHLDLSQVEEPDSEAALFTSDKSWKSTTLSVRVRPFTPAAHGSNRPSPALHSSEKSYVHVFLRVQGNCTVLPLIPSSSEPPLLPLRRGQCLLQTQRRLFQIAEPDSRRPFWLDNFYVRSEVWSEVVWQETVETRWSLWLSRLTLQDVTRQSEPVVPNKSFLTLDKGAKLFVQGVCALVPLPVQSNASDQRKH